METAGKLNEILNLVDFSVELVGETKAFRNIYDDFKCRILLSLTKTPGIDALTDPNAELGEEATKIASELISWLATQDQYFRKFLS